MMRPFRASVVLLSLGITVVPVEAFNVFRGGESASAPTNDQFHHDASSANGDGAIEMDMRGLGEAARNLQSATTVDYDGTDLSTTHAFAPLACNANIGTCEAWSTKAPDYTDPDSGKMTIPCGSCLTVDIVDASTVTLPGGLHVEGKLDFPNEARVTIATPSIIVEGELAMVSTDKVTGDPKVKFVMTGSTDVVYLPHADNRAVNGVDTQYNVGTRPIVVAGGKLSISGIPESCPTWVRLQDVESVGAPVPAEGTYPSPPVVDDSCPAGEDMHLIDENFDAYVHPYPSGWIGDKGAKEVLSSEDALDGTQYLKITNRKKSWQGPTYNLNPVKSCLQPGATLFFSAKIRVTLTDKHEGGDWSHCVKYGFSCPQLKYSYMDSEDLVHFNVLAEPKFKEEDRPADGTWYDIVAAFSLDEFQLAEDIVYNQISVVGPEAGVDISIDNVVLKYNPSLYPPPGNVCGSIAINGDAEEGLFPYPFRGNNIGRTRSGYLSVEAEGDGNHFFKMSGRTAPFSTMILPIHLGCAIPGTSYRFSSRVKLFSETASHALALIKTVKADGTVTHKTLDICPDTSNSIGWVECSGTFVFSAMHEDAQRVEVLWVFNQNDEDDVGFDDVVFDFASGGKGAPVFDPESGVDECWDVGAEILVASSSLDPEGGHVETLEGFYTTESNNLSANFQGGDIPLPPTLAKYPNSAGELALLSRNIAFESDDGESGGHLVVFRTPGGAGGGADQLLQGCAFKGFGQKGEAARFPISFHMGGESAGSVVSKNAIVQSHQRCVVLTGTNNVQVTHNVAHDTLGHCYALGSDGTSTGNTFSSNLGALTKRAAKEDIILGESDNYPATFYLTHPSNTWSGNVAAGSYDSGYWIHTKESSDEGGPDTLPLTSFVDNVSHSNKAHGVKTWPEGYNPAATSSLRNTRSYLNQDYGIFVHDSQNIIIEGGYIADNRIGVEINYADSIDVNGTTVVGYSDAFIDEVHVRGVEPHDCAAEGEPIVGIRTFANSRNPSMTGSSIANVHFEKFGDESFCPGIVAIKVNEVVRDGSFTSQTSFKDLQFTGASGAHAFSICDLSTVAGVTDVAIEDNGSLNPAGSGEAGFIMSDDETLTAFLGDTGCTVMEGSCAQYCRDACMRKVAISVNAQGTEDVKLHVDDGTGGTPVQLVGSFSAVSTFDDTYYNRERIYSAALPGGTFSATFKDVDGNDYWPDFALVSVDDPPGSCDGYMESFDLTVPDAAATGACDQMIKNSDFSEGDAAQSMWVHVGGGLKYVTGSDGTGSALSTDGRTDWLNGPAVYLDSRCLVEGTSYEVKAKMRVRQEDGSPYECDIHAKSGLNVCPRGSIRSMKDGQTLDYSWGVAMAAGPWTTGEWNAFYGRFTVDEHMASADKALFFIERLNPGVEIQIDDVTISPIEQSCTDLITNGDFEEGHYALWSYTGSAKLKLVSPGAPDPTGAPSGHALSTEERVYNHWSPSQFLSPDCLEENAQYVVTGDIKLVDYDGNEVTCNPQYESNIKGSCTVLVLKVVKNGASTFREVASTVGPYDTTRGGWQKLYGVFMAEPDDVAADSIQVYMTTRDVNNNQVLDNLSIVKATDTTSGLVSCNDLIRNTNFADGDARFYLLKGAGALEMYTPGHGGNQHAIRHVGGRFYSWYGIRNNLDSDCLVQGETWEINAWFKIINPSNNEPVGCNRAAQIGDNVCPMITVFSQSQTNQRENYNVWPTLSELPDTWDAAIYNQFKGTFTVSANMANSPKVLYTYVNKVKKGLDIVLGEYSIKPVAA